MTTRLANKITRNYIFCKEIHIGNYENPLSGCVDFTSHG